MKDFATKKTRITGKQEATLITDSMARVPIGRWVLLGVVVVVMVGYAIWSHHGEFSDWLLSLGHHRSSAKPASTNISNPSNTSNTSKNSTKNAGKSDLTPPPIQFDFYHVLANDSGKGEASVELLESSVSANSKSSGSSVTSSNSVVAPDPKSQVNTQDSSTAPPEAKDLAPVAKASPKVAVKALEKPPVKAVPIKTPIKNPIKASIKAPTTTKTESYEVQVAIFSSKDKAESMRAKLMLLGFEPKVSSGSNGRYGVYFPPVKNEHAAETLRHQLAKAGVNSSLVAAAVPVSEGESHAE